MVIEYAPLEDELGDVLEKAMHHHRVTEQILASRAQVPLEKIRDAIDYRCDFSSEELKRLAAVLSLNEVGVLALAQSRYPLPEISGLPFCLYPLRTPHGIGVANAYLVAECGGDTGLLFDAGPERSHLNRLWPKSVRGLKAIFVTHAEQEHIGGLDAIRKAYPAAPLFGPSPVATLPALTTEVDDGALFTFANFQVQVFRTPGHVEAHNCYVVSVPMLRGASSLLISGDLLFAGSVGGAYYCQRQLGESLQRLMAELPESTVVAPGHGPLTTLRNERNFNPFVH